MGADGDGVASHGGATFYLPFTLPGERVQAHPVARHGNGWIARATAILEHSPDRQPPSCAHFGACGGCAFQNWDDKAALAWKRDQLARALDRAGYETDIHFGPRTPPRARRRMDLALRRTAGGILAGLHAHRSRTIIDLAECHVLHPALFALLAPLRALLADLAALKQEGSAVANLLDSGPDLLLRTDAAPTAADRARLADFARRHDLPRISWALGNGEPEPVCILRPPTTRLSGQLVVPAPGAFLQASAEGEQAIVEAVRAALPPGRPRIAELYAGCGTLTHALGKDARITAYEGDSQSVAALRASGHPATQQRDLSRQPLTATDLRRFDAVLLDPPYAGAAAQMPHLAASRVPRVIYVSCNPHALARDAATLRQAGYALRSATLIDQFLWSARIESVTAFALRPARDGNATKSVCPAT